MEYIVLHFRYHFRLAKFVNFSLPEFRTWTGRLLAYLDNKNKWYHIIVHHIQ